MGGSSKSPSVAAASAAAEAPTEYTQERDIEESAQNARANQLKRAKAALGQEGSVVTSPFGTQQSTEQKKTLLGG